jgi:hypothetical protein
MAELLLCAASESCITYWSESWQCHVRECRWLVGLLSAGNVTRLPTVSTSCGWSALLSVTPAAVWPNSAEGSRAQRCIVSKLTSAVWSSGMFRPVIGPSSCETSAQCAKASTVKMRVTSYCHNKQRLISVELCIAILPGVAVLLFNAREEPVLF